MLGAGGHIVLEDTKYTYETFIEGDALVVYSQIDDYPQRK